jgi:DNA polymerase-3 subunit gamma/tau
VASHSLYRKYRPQRFSEMEGQEHVTNALRNAVTEDRVGHAYLFSGPRGTGKTTTARLLARSLNCLDLGADGEPCGKCENCEAIAHGTFYDLVELDAASNNGVEAMRDLIQSVHLGVGASSRRKVYIVDEVHMLSAAASNTLLKTLEEPPPHVVFVLATTDPQKVLPTIRSRTQHFEFTLLTREQLVDHLGYVLEREGVDADADALDLVARRAAGSARDALSILDQALAVGAGRLDAEQVQAAFGGAPFDQRLAVLEAAANDDVAGVLVGVHELLAAGHDARRVADDLLRTLRDAFLQANAKGRVPYDGPLEEGERLGALAQQMGNPAVVRAIEILGQAIIDIRGQAVADPRLVLEVALVRVARHEARTRDETLLDRVERLEQRLATDAPPLAPPVTAPTTTAANAPAPAPRATPDANGPVLARRERKVKSVETPSDPSALPTAEAAPAADVALDDVIEAWPDVLSALKPPVRAVVQDAQPVAVEDGVIVFGVPSQRAQMVNEKFRKEAEAIKDAFAQRLGAPPRFKLTPHDFSAPDAFHGHEPPPPPAVDDGDDGDDGDDVDSVDLTELTDAPASTPPPDSVSRLVTDLGAEIIDERRRG